MIGWELGRVITTGDDNINAHNCTHCASLMCASVRYSFMLIGAHKKPVYLLTRPNREISPPHWDGWHLRLEMQIKGTAFCHQCGCGNTPTPRCEMPIFEKGDNP